MLTHVDVFLGVAMVMLAVSLLLTIVTQSISLIFNLRGTALRNGLAELFTTLKAGDGTALAEKILKHKLISDAGFIPRLAAAVTRADVLRLLDEGETLLDLSAVQKAKIVEARKDIEAWFDGTMTRVAHQFTLHTRIVTVVAAFAAAFLIHLDSFGLVSRLYKDSDLRASMAGVAGSVVTQGQQVLTTPSAFATAASALAAQNASVLPPPVSAISTRAEAQAWIHQAVHGDKREQELLDAYDERLAAAVGPALKTWLTQAQTLKRDLDSTSFTLIPEGPRDYGWTSLLGLFVSGCLLSLGAPFWFNALKTVSNLRPTIAAQVEAREPKEREAAV